MKKQWLLALVLVIAIVVTLLPASTAIAQDGERAYQQGVADTNSLLAVRAEPSLAGEVLLTVEPGTVLDVYEVDGVWTRVGYEGIIGWAITQDLVISSKMLNLQATVASNSAQAIRVEPSISGETITTVEPGSILGVLMVDGLWAYVYNGEAVGWIFEDRLQITDPTDELSFVLAEGVTRGNSDVAVRAEADLDAEVLTTLATEVEVGVMGYSSNGLFAYVMYDGGMGWVFARNVTVSSRPVAIGAINSGPANFRDAPDGATFNRLAFGARVFILGRSEDGAWLNVRYVDGGIFIDGVEADVVEGWISASLIDTDGDVASFPVTE